MTPFPPDRVLDLVSPDQRRFLQAKAWQWVALGILDLQTDAARSRGSIVQDQVLSLEDERLCDKLSAVVTGVDRDEPIGPQGHALQMDAGRGVVPS